MLPKIAFCLLLCIYSAVRPPQPTIIGTWRRVIPNAPNRDTTDKRLMYMDLVIRADSTFHMEGDVKARASTVPGWSSADDRNGTWQILHGNRVIFRFDPPESRMSLGYYIISLTAHELVLTPPTGVKSKFGDIRYLRL